MIKSKHIKYLGLIVLLLGFTIAGAQDIPPKPNPPRLVNDFSNTLSKAEIDKLERKLVAFNDTTSNQIAVVLVESLQGYDPAQFALEIGEKWGVGGSKFNNGIVVLVKPKISREKGRAFIATGYGLEGPIPDAIAKRVVENEMIPEFRNNNYYTGIDNATNVLMDLAAGEISEEQYRKQTESFPYAGIIPFIIIAIIFLLINLSRRRTYSMGDRKERGTDSLWTALFLGSMLGGGRHHGSGWNDFSGGSGSFGGGGSFGGFGGGSFGGGGAGGSW